MPIYPSPNPVRFDGSTSQATDSYYKVRVGTYRAAGHRSYTKFNSLNNSGVPLIFACLEAKGEALAEALAARDAWSLKLPVILVDRSDLESLRLRGPVFTGDKKSMVDLEPEVDPAAEAESKFDRDREAEFNADPDHQRKLPRKKKPSKPKALTRKEKEEENYRLALQMAVYVSEEELQKLAASFRQHDKDQREQFAAGLRVLSFRLARCSRFKAIHKAEALDDVAQKFTVHILDLLNRNKYKEQGKFVHWVGKVWSGRDYRAYSENLIWESDNLFGIDFNQPYGDEGESCAAPGYLGIKELQVAMQEKPTARHYEDSVTMSHQEKLSTLRPSFSPEENALIDAVSVGDSHKIIANREHISTKTVQRRLEGIKKKAQGLVPEQANVDGVQA